MIFTLQAVESDLTDAGICQPLVFESHHDNNIPRSAIPDVTGHLADGKNLIIPRCSVPSGPTLGKRLEFRSIGTGRKSPIDLVLQCLGLRLHVASNPSVMVVRPDALPTDTRHEKKSHDTKHGPSR